MNAIFRLLTCLLFFCSLLCFSQISHAEEGGTVREIIVEALCPIDGTNTPAKAEEQALLLAKKNALEQAGVQNVAQIYIDSLPKDVFDVTVLDKKKVIEGSRLSYWVQIKALIKPDQMEAAVKGINPIWGGPAEYYSESISYENGKEIGRGKNWTKNGWDRSEMDGMITIVKAERKDNVITSKSWYLKNNKFFESEPGKMIKEEVSLGMEQINGIWAKKKRINYIYPDLKFSTTIVEWIDPTTNCTLKVENEMNGIRYVTIYQDQQIGPLDDSLFVIPAGYTKCASLEELYLPTNSRQKTTDSTIDTVTQKVVEKVLDGLINSSKF